MKSPILKYFECSHLPPNLQPLAGLFRDMAMHLEDVTPDGPEKSAGFRKLLEAKDCFVRAKL
jgi:hypothetical protein